MSLRQPRRAGLLLATGQTTVYSGEADDAFYLKGLLKSYTILTTGAYSSTSNVDLTHLARNDISFTAPVAQAETATVVGTITTTGNATFTVTAANSPALAAGKAISVGVVELDDAAAVAGKARTVLGADGDVAAFFTVGGAGADVILTALATAANDTTMNLAYIDGTCVGLTADATSTDTTAGALGILTCAGQMGVFKVAGGETIVVTGSTSNNLTLTTTAAGANTVTVTGATVTEAAGDNVVIAKREAHSNNCVLDNNTGLMWSRYASSAVGVLGTGLMPWTGQTYDIFAYAAAANAAAVAGYSDWRIPNDMELASLRDMEVPMCEPDTTAFPSWPITDSVWTSTTYPYHTGKAMLIYFVAGYISYGVKATETYFTALVRGG